MSPISKRWPRNALLLTFLFGLSLNLVQSAPEADAEADPQAEAIPDPDPQFLMMPPMRPTYPVRPPMNPSYPMSPCEMTNQCCGMANANCCVGGQKCYTAYERKCEMEDDPQCQMTTEQVCSSQNIPTCRLVTEVVERQFPGSSCKAQPVKKCWNIEKKVCTLSTETVSEDIIWKNEMLQPLGETVKEHCFDQTEFDCSERVYSEMITTQVEKTRVIPDSRQQCTNVPVVGESSTVTVPVVSITYRTACYDIPAPRCSTSMCGTGSCEQGQSVCSMNDYSTQTICPTGLNNPNQNCQQIQSPVCYGQGVQCNVGVQQCCGQQTQRVCRQVPERNVQQVTRVVPGRVSYQRKCETINFSRTETYMAPEQQMVNRTKTECPPKVVKKCINIKIPEYKVVSEEKVFNITAQSPKCNFQTIQEKVCHTIEDGESTCVDNSIKKSYKITKNVCDGQKSQPVCQNVPKMNCRRGTKAKCKIVPRQVCQESCSESPLCNECNQFLEQGPGFGSCPNSECGTIIPSSPWSYNDETSNSGGITEYPGDFSGFYRQNWNN